MSMCKACNPGLKGFPLSLGSRVPRRSPKVARSHLQLGSHSQLQPQVSIMSNILKIMTPGRSRQKLWQLTVRTESDLPLKTEERSCILKQLYGAGALC